MINYAADPRFQVIREGEIPVYFLKDEYITELHKSREVEAQIQNIYSNSGATAEYLSKFCDELILKLVIFKVGLIIIIICLLLIPFRSV